VGLAPTAAEISVRQVLAKLEGDFASMANAVENGEFALWVGSGISRRAPSLGNLIERAFNYIREKAIAPPTAGTFLPALEEALAYAGVLPADVAGNYTRPLAEWPQRDAIITQLWTKYSRVLDIRIAGSAADFILWDAINIRQAFANPEPPTSEHLCIAILILEGAVQSIASANWDGFIEQAVERLSNSAPGVLQVVVDPNQLRGPPGRARLLKFHGCIVHATREPLIFRRFLTGSHTQIMDWPENADFAAMCGTVVALATTHKTLVLGLSIQDNNLQTLFARAKELHAWPWPCAPAAPAHIFCEDRIQEGQRDTLRLSYGEAYNNNSADLLRATLLRAWGEQVLIALVLKLLCDKLARLMELAFEDIGKSAIAPALAPSLKTLRDDVAGHAICDPGAADRTTAVNRGITMWSRMLSLFRTGSLPANPDVFEILSQSTPLLISTDHNARAASLGRLGVALSLLQNGRAAGLWDLRQPIVDDLAAGSLTARALRADGVDRPLFIVKSATEAINLKRLGAFANDNAIIVHADDAWRQMVQAHSPRRLRVPPGRTGSIKETHVSLGEILARSNDATALQNEFVAEMML